MHSEPIQIVKVITTDHKIKGKLHSFNSDHKVNTAGNYNNIYMKMRHQAKNNHFLIIIR